MRRYLKYVLISILLLASGYAGTGQCVKEAYTKEIGVRELTGNNDGERVDYYLNACGYKGSQYPYCACFVTACQLECGRPIPNSPAWSPSWFPDERVIYSKGNVVYGDEAYQVPDAGDVFGVYYVSKGRIAHVGFVDEWRKGRFFVTVEGNTNDAGSREGDGVYRKWRLKGQIQKVSRWRE